MLQQTIVQPPEVQTAAAGASTSPPFDISVPELALSFALVFVAVALSRWQRLGLERGFLAGAIRAVAQLAAVGYVLVYLFEAEKWWLVMSALAAMLVAGTVTATRRLGGTMPTDRRQLLTLTGAAMFVSSGLTLAYVSYIVIGVHPWYEPRYLIPLFGMIVGSAMNGAALALERLTSEMEAHRRTVEAYLALGATPARASAEPVRRALTAALIPSINGLMVVGLVQLPGMMTGQILAGQSPLLAIRYQIVVAFMLAGATAMTSVLVALWYRRSFFTAAAQLAVRAPV